MIFNSGSIPIDVKLVRVSELKKHERIIPQKLRELKLYLRNKTILKNPIIIDKNHVILDGNHRANAFNQLDFKYICACQINYFNQNVKLRYWDRKFPDFLDFQSIKTYLKNKSCTFTEFADRERLLKFQKSHRLGFGLHYQNLYYYIQFPQNLVQNAVMAYNQMENVQKCINVSPQFFPDKYLNQTEFLNAISNTDLIITTPRIRKDMVIHAAKNKQLFAPKSTRHIIPSRPLNLNIPITFLNSKKRLSKAQAELEQFLRKKELIRFGPGQVIEGRYYEEEILVFLDRNN